MATLADEVKTFIVQQLAMYDAPSVVAAAVKDLFGLELDRRLVRNYDPTVAREKDRAGKKWQALFRATREAFLDETVDIGIANKVVRLRRLDRMATRLEDRGNVLGAAQLMEQAAKEAGGMFTNRREITGKDGTPLVPAEMTDEELTNRLAEILVKGKQRRDVAKGVAPKGAVTTKKKAAATA